MKQPLHPDYYDVAYSPDDRESGPGAAISALDGLWTLRFGLFGCRDDETHGGVLHIEGDRMAGGDGQLIFHGRFTLTGTTLTASLQAVRHGSGRDYAGVFGALPPLFRLEVVADAITPKLFEGRVLRRNGPEIRVVMRRFEPMGDRSQMV